MTIHNKGYYKIFELPNKIDITVLYVRHFIFKEVSYFVIFAKQDRNLISIVFDNEHCTRTKNLIYEAEAKMKNEISFRYCDIKNEFAIYDGKALLILKLDIV